MRRATVSFVATSTLVQGARGTRSTIALKILMAGTGLIFIGYTVYAAYRRQNIDGEPCGHDQLDSLGFD